MKKKIRSFAILFMMLLTITGCHKSYDRSNHSSNLNDDKNHSSNLNGDTNNQNTSSSTLSQDDVLQTVMEQVSGLEKGNIYVEKEIDDGILKYEGTAIYNQIEYEFEVDGNTGRLLKWNSQESSLNNVNHQVSIDQIFDTVINKIPGIEKGNIFLQSEYDDGQAVYEGKAIYGNIEYEFEINANTGNILEWNIKR